MLLVEVDYNLIVVCLVLPEVVRCVPNHDQLRSGEDPGMAAGSLATGKASANSLQ